MNNKQNFIQWRALALILVIVVIFFVFKFFVAPGRQSGELAVDSLVFKRGCQNDSGPCLKIALKFPVLQGESSNNFCINVLGDYLSLIDIETKCRTLDEFKTALLNYAYSIDSSYVLYSQEFKRPIVNPWFVDISLDTIYSTRDIRVLAYTYNDYMGGAHGSYMVHYQNVSLKGYRLIALSEAVSDTVALASVVEPYFVDLAKQRGMRYPDDFWFERGKFSLPHEFAFTQSGLLLHYNPYEVASYAQGVFEVLVPYRAIEHLLVD